MELFWDSCESEAFKNSILSIENPTAQKVIDSEYFIQAACLDKALRICLEREKVNVLDYEELNKFVTNFFGAENIEYEVKDGIHISGDEMGNNPDDVRYEIVCTLSDKRQKWNMTIDNSGEMISGPITNNFDISKLFSNEKKMIYDGNVARVIKYTPAYEGETFSQALESNGCTIERRVELPSHGVKYDFIDKKGNRKYALGYIEDPTYEYRMMGIHDDEMRDPEFAVYIISDCEIVRDGASDYSFYEHLSYFLKYDIEGWFDLDFA